MSSEAEKSKVEVEEKKRIRRTKKNDVGRDFLCPCGKSYLSYPALYTHIKNKHNGKTPTSSFTDPSIKMQYNGELADKNCLQAIADELQRFLGGLSVESDKDFFPDFSASDQEYLAMIEKNWHQKQDDQQTDGYTYTQTIDTVFGRFLHELKPRVKAEGYQYLCSLILQLKQGINKEKGSQNYCKENLGNQLPILFNSMIQNDHLTSQTPEKLLMSLKVLLLKILFYLGSWLYLERYTNYKIKFNVE